MKISKPPFLQKKTCVYKIGGDGNNSLSPSLVVTPNRHDTVGGKLCHDQRLPFMGQQFYALPTVLFVSTPMLAKMWQPNLRERLRKKTDFTENGRHAADVIFRS